MADAGDIQRLYNKTLCIYRGMPVFVDTVDERSQVTFINLLTGKSTVVKYIATDFSAPRGRIGYVNCNGVAYYVKRMPVRRFHDGIHAGNVTIKATGADLIRHPVEVKSLTHVGYAYALFNQYPSLEEAFNGLDKGTVSVAFDKQFAITANRVYYKGVLVGSHNKKELTFLPEKEYLRGLIGISYEKDV